MNNLANAYLYRIRGERAENLEQAIAHYQQVLEVMTRQAMPLEWATTMNNLANSYRNRIRGERVGNLEQAIAHYQQALELFTVDRFPNDHRRTQRNLGNLHFGEKNWSQAHAAYAASIEAGAALLASAYTEVGRRAEVGETARLYAQDAYCLLRLGQSTEAFLRLDQGKTRLLSEALALQEADLQLLPKDQQAALQEARRAVRELEAELRMPQDTPARRNERELSEKLRTARGKLYDLVEAIRAEHSEFMPTGLDLDGLLSLVPADGALIAPLFTS